MPKKKGKKKVKSKEIKGQLGKKKETAREKMIGQTIGYRYDVNLLPDYSRLTPFLKKYIEAMGWDDLNWLEDVHMGYEEGRPAVFDRNANGWVTIPKKIKLPNDQQSRDMIARELLINARTLREYFGIEWSENLGNILHQFNEHFAQFIPEKVDLSKSKLIKIAMTKSLSESDSEDPSKIYCYGVRRNPDNGTRSIFNDNKSRLLRSKLYEKFMGENTISFCYSSDKKREKNDSQIIKNFTKK